MVEGLERRAPRREGHRPGDPGRQDLRGGHRRRHHRRQRALPGVQHLAGRRTAVPEAGRPGRARHLRRWRGLRRGAQRRRRRAVPVAGRAVLPDPVEVEPGDDLLQQGHHEEGRRRPGEPAARDVRRVPRHQPEDRRQRRRGRGHLAGADQRVLPVLVRLLPAVRRRDRWQAAGRGRQGDLRLRRGQGRRRLLDDDVRRGAVARRRSTTATPSPTRRPRCRSSVPGRSRSTATRSTGAPYRSRPRPAPPGGDLHLLRRQEHRALLGLREPGHRLRGPEVRDQRGAGRQAAGADRPDAAAHRPAGDLPRLLQGAPGVRALRRPGARTVEVPNVPNSIEIWQTLPRRVLVLGDLRQDPGRRRAVARRPTRSPSSPASPEPACRR